jgi:hypothetical protein
MLFCNILLRLTVLNLILNSKNKDMKLLTKMILCLVFAGYSLLLSAQGSKKHSIGFQVNPYIDDLLFTSTSVKPVYALRYTYNVNDNLSLGPEFSGYHIIMQNLDPNFTISNFNIGAFARYSLLPRSRIKPFFELSPYYTFHSYKNFPEANFYGTLPPGKTSYFSGYIAPGITLYSKSRNVSLDLMYKFSNKQFVNGNKSVFSYRLNINF